MKLTKTIASSLFTHIWAIKKSELDNLALQYVSLLKAGMLPDDDDDIDTTPNIPSLKNNIAGLSVIPIFGILVKHLSGDGIMDYNDIQSQLQSALDDPNISTILLYIHSPGGWDLGLQSLSDFIYSASQEKPIYTYIDGLCCSAAYWLASQTTAIYSTRDSLIGNVGAYMESVNIFNMLKASGIESHVFASHPDKVAGNPDTEWQNEYNERFQSDIKDRYDKFIEAINRKRIISNEYLTGWSYRGEQALQYGFTDGIIESLSDAITFIANNNNSTIS